VGESGGVAVVIAALGGIAICALMVLGGLGLALLTWWAEPRRHE
jgi:hypothetical protein